MMAAMGADTEHSGTEDADRSADRVAAESQHRAEVIAAQEQALHRARQAEHEKATVKIRTAIEKFRAAGIEPIPLRARPYTGSGTIRTALRGWYLKTDQSLGIDEDGRFYVLRVDGGILSRLRGATPEPSLAPLVVGRGARDGETFDIDELLQMRLEDPVRP